MGEESKDLPTGYDAVYGTDVDRQEKIVQGVRLILEALGVDLEDRNFATTPERYAGFIKNLFWTPRPTVTTFTEQHDQMVIMRGHECWTLCPHHLLPVRFQMAEAQLVRLLILVSADLNPAAASR